METPSHILYADLKAFGHISNRDAAMILLSPTASANGMPIRGRAGTDRTFLSRDIVHARPGRYGTEAFNSFPRSAQQLENLILSHLREAGSGPAQFDRHYRGQAADSMRNAIARFGQDGNLYQNALDRIWAAKQLGDGEKSHLGFMLFVATGCLGDPRVSIGIVDAYSRACYADGLHTMETRIGSERPSTAAAEDDVCLGILRIDNGEARLPVYPLSLEPEGTIIGALAPGAQDVTAVGSDVSARHARIWRSHGTWWLQGLYSTNGTTLVSGDTREVTVVEPPQSQREPGREYGPVRISNSDVLRLGASTEFLVMRIAGEKS